MALCDFGKAAPGFSLPGTDGRKHTLDSVKGPNGLLVMFICNHCPYVKAVLDRIIRDARDLKELGIACVAISSNDAATYPEVTRAALLVMAGRVWVLGANGWLVLFEADPTAFRPLGQLRLCGRTWC